LSRALGPADYGAFVALLSLFLLLAIPMNTLQTTIALEASTRHPEHLGPFILGLLRVMRRRWLQAGLLGWVVLALASPWIARVLQLPTALPVIVMGGYLVIATLLPAIRGIFQGTHAFGLLGATFLIETSSKLLVGLTLVAFGLGVSGATGGIILGAAVALVYGLWALPRPDPPREGAAPITMSPLLPSAVPIGLTLLFFAVMTSADVIAVKVLFPPREAGYYAAASTAGRIVLFATWPVWAVLFPAMGRTGSASRMTRRGLWLGIGLTVLIAAPILAFYVLAPHLATRILFGHQFLPGASLFWPLGLAMLAYQVAFLGMSHELAVGRQRFLRLAGLSTVVLVGLLILIPRTLTGVALTTLAVGAVTAALMSWIGLASKVR